MRSAIVLLMLSAAAGTLAAQSALVVAPGQRIWVRDFAQSRSPYRELKGTVDRVAADTVLIRPDGAGALVWIVPTATTQFRIYERRGSSTGLGVAVGVAVGGLAGIVYGLQRDCSSTIGNFADCVNRDLTVFLEALVSGIGGGIVGMVVGSAIGHDVWSRPMKLAEARLPTIATGHAVGLRLSLRLN